LQPLRGIACLAHCREGVLNAKEEAAAAQIAKALTDKTALTHSRDSGQL